MSVVEMRKLAWVALVLILVGSVMAESFPSRVSSQGSLKNLTTNVGINGTNSFNVTLYNLSSDAQLYSEVTTINITNGIWNYDWGRTTAINSGIFSESIYAIFKIAGETHSRVNLTAVPYAFRALTTNNSDYLNGVIGSSYTLKSYVDGLNTTWDAADQTVLSAGENITSGTVADARVADSISRDSEALVNFANINNTVNGTSNFSGVVRGMYNDTRIIQGGVNIAGENVTTGTVADARIASTIARDSEVIAFNGSWLASNATSFGGLTPGQYNNTWDAVDQSLLLAGENITAGTVADARVASTLARDSEVQTANNSLRAYADSQFANFTPLTTANCSSTDKYSLFYPNGTPGCTADSGGAGSTTGDFIYTYNTSGVINFNDTKNNQSIDNRITTNNLTIKTLIESYNGSWAASARAVLISGDNVTSGTVNDSYIAASIARDTEIQTANNSMKSYVDTATTPYVNRSNWSSIDNYPVACSAGQFVSAVGDTLTCSTPTGDINWINASVNSSIDNRILVNNNSFKLYIGSTDGLDNITIVRNATLNASIDARLVPNNNSLITYILSVNSSNNGVALNYSAINSSINETLAQHNGSLQAINSTQFGGLTPSQYNGTWSALTCTQFGNLTPAQYNGTWDAADQTVLLDGANITAGTVAEARIASTIATDAEVSAAYLNLTKQANCTSTDKYSLFYPNGTIGCSSDAGGTFNYSAINSSVNLTLAQHNGTFDAADQTVLSAGENITSGTVADARVASTITRDTEAVLVAGTNVLTNNWNASKNITVQCIYFSAGDGTAPGFICNG